MSERRSSSRWWNICILQKLHCFIAIQVEKSNLMFSFLNGRNAWEFFKPLTISVCALWALPTYTTSLCWFRDRGQQTQAPGHILPCFSGFLAVINVAFPIFCEVFRGMWAFPDRNKFLQRRFYGGCCTRAACGAKSQWHPPDAAEGSARSCGAQQAARASFHHLFAEQNTFPKHGALFALGSLSGGDPAVHFHVCELPHVLSALWGGDGGDNVLQAQEHGEKQDQEDSQEG